jgi:LysR family transcriptional regulator, hydrogen peroxide-inducible genes activator
MISIKGLDGLTVRDMAALVALGELKHFGKAARECGLAQPSLSAIVKKAEAGLGASLFIRSPKGVSVTPEGRRTLSAFQDALALLQLAHQAAALDDTWTGTFRLGIIPTLAPYFLPEALPLLRREHAEIDWELVEAQTHRLVRLLLEGRLDAALLSLPTGESALEEIALFQEELVLAVPETHHFASRESVNVGEIDPKEMILLERGHCLREDVLRQCSATPVSAKPTHAASLEIQRLMVKAGTGCAVFPALAVDWDRNADGIIRYIPFDSPPPSRTVGLVFRRAHPRNPAVKAIAATLRSVPTVNNTQPRTPKTQ